MPQYVLYGHPESGHSYKVALALQLMAADWEYRPIEVFAPRETRREDWRAHSRFGEIPLLLDGGAPVSQSDAILLHLARTTGALAGDGDLDRVAEWLFWEANRIGLSLPNLRLYTKWEQAAPALTDWLRARLEADMSRLAAEFEARPFLLGDQVSVCDLACCGYMFFADQAGVEVEDWPPVARWLDRIRALPGWKHPYELMPATGA